MKVCSGGLYVLLLPTFTIMRRNKPALLPGLPFPRHDFPGHRFCRRRIEETQVSLVFPGMIGNSVIIPT